MKIPDLDKEKISYGKYYYFDNNTYTVDASGSEAELEYLCSDFTITKVIYNEDTQNFKYEMFLETPNGEKEVTVDKSVFTSRNLESLTVKGFSFNPDRTKEVLMLALLAAFVIFSTVFVSVTIVIVVIFIRIIKIGFLTFISING